jgi:hypothetical protein
MLILVIVLEAQRALQVMIQVFKPARRADLALEALQAKRLLLLEPIRRDFLLLLVSPLSSLRRGRRGWQHLFGWRNIVYFLSLVCN